MGCVSSNNKEKLSQDDLETILAVPPQEWTQGQVIKWLQLTHDGDLKDLVDAFKQQKISGVTFVKLTEKNLKEDLNITQFGLRDGFIAARNKLLIKHETKDTKQPIHDSTQPNSPKNTEENQNKSEIQPINNIHPESNITKDESIVTQTKSLAISNNEIIQQGTMSYGISHQTTPSGHLITQPKNVRHNQSFDNSGDGNSSNPNASPMPPMNMNNMNMGQMGMNAMGINNMNMSMGQGMNMHNMNTMNVNNINQMGINNMNSMNINNNNGAYEEIPDTFSPMQQNNIGFTNMPQSAFQDDVAPEDDNYASVDPADLNDSIPGITSNGYSMHASHINGGTSSVSGRTAPNNPNQNNNNLYQMTSYQSNQIGYNNANNNSNNQSSNTGINSIHNHTQTGSNYDELPLEFIHNIPNPSVNENNNKNNNNGNINDPTISGYQEIEFNDHDDNVSSVPSNVPSNVSSYQNNRYGNNNNIPPKIAIGSCVKVFDRNNNKWVEAQVEKVDNINHTVSVKFLAHPFSKILVSTRDIRQLSPPKGNANNNNTKMDENNTGIDQVSPSGDHPQTIMSLEEKQIHEFARDLWKTLHKIDVKTIPDQHNEPIRGFSGKELVKHVKKHLKKHVSNMNDRDINLRCNDLVKYQYIRLIASAKDNKTNPTNNNNNIEDFTDSEKYLYQFENEKHREFIKDDQPDRRAWTRGTKVEIYSATLGGWQTGTVVEVNADTLTITYGPPTQQMRKTLDRYQDDLVKSTSTFIENRRGWKKDHEIEVYSHGQHIWCQGRIEEVLSAKENQPVDIFRVFYTNNDDKDFSKYVDRWSPDLREVQQLSPKLAKYKKGTKVRVWSNSKQTWVPGVVIDVVPTYEVVNVRYGDHEKLVPVSSDDIKLLADED